MRNALNCFCRWRAKWCAKMAIRSMNILDYRGAAEWLRLAKTWEGRVRQ